MTLAEALNLVATRGRLTDGLSSDGGMAAVGLSHAEVERRLAAGDSSSPNPAGARHAINGASLRKRLSIAAVNAPDQVVLSGDAAALRDFVEPLAREGVFVHWLEVSHAFHSRHVEPMLAEFGRALERVVWRSPQIPVISNLTGRPADDEIATPEYWRRHLRETVRFQQGMEAAGALADVFLEIGPKPVLLGFGRKILTDRDAAAWLPSLRPPLDDWTTLLDSLCSLAMSGVEIDWENFDREYPRRRVSLPTYPFQRKRYWIERPQGGRATIPSKSTPRLDASSRRHPLLHQRWRSPLIAETVFEAEISLEESPFIADHRFFGTAIMPATAYLEMGLCAAGNFFGAGSRALMNVEFSEVLPLEEQKRQRLQLVAGKPEGRRAPFRVISIQEETATANDCRLHVQGELGRADDIKVEAWNPPTVERIGERCPRRISREEFYEAIREHDVFMGEQFQVVDECFFGDGELWGRVRIPPGIADRSSFDVPSPILDACLQLIPGGVPYDVEMTLLPVGIERLAFHGALGDAGLWCRAVLRTDGATGDKVVVADAWLIDDAEAFDALADLWQRGAAEGLVLAVDWERYRRQFVGGRPQPMLEIVAPAVSESGPEQDAFRRHWTEAADYERRALVEELTRRLVGAAVGFDEIGADDSFFDLGLDSLASVQLRNDLQEYLGLELPATLIFMHPTLDQLNRYLTEDVLALDISMASGRVNGDNFIADNIAIPKEDANSLEVLSDGELAERLSTMLAALQSESA